MNFNVRYGVMFCTPPESFHQVFFACIFYDFLSIRFIWRLLSSKIKILKVINNSRACF